MYSMLNVCVSTSEYRHGGCLSSSIVTQESSDLTFVHVEGEITDCLCSLLLLLLPRHQLGEDGLVIDFGQVADRNSNF